ncbi:MAG: inositol monophosphatase [Thermoanaerobaculaceae bacterium]|nr:inositol monophosphatase [Thermoanaerobaculaceae bacterium]MDI9621938.1 inositol monophosphatase family protein [Acidobacteriota bacterium]NLH12248.1 inositol monophosphatase [Holophagae bacterium]HPW55648.1 inositol monophosphatase family protein [Thermoanaerobaculaceae bacterium]
MRTPPIGYAGLLPLAITAAELGADVLRRYFRELGPSQISEKLENDVVTDADHAAETAVVRLLHERTPELGILAEERGASGQSEARWVLDPLDGTLNFVRGFPHFAVSLALVTRSGIELGVVVDPMRRETFYAVAGGGAFRNGVPITVSRRQGLAGAFVTTGFPYRIKPYFDDYVAIFRDAFDAVGALRRPGAAALDLAHTAAGIFDGFFEFGLSIWDVAAGMLIVREAGGKVTDATGGDEVFRNGNIVAGGPTVQAALLGLIGRHLPESRIPLP